MKKVKVSKRPYSFKFLFVCVPFKCKTNVWRRDFTSD